MFEDFKKAEKNICFEDFDKKHADLKIRLHYDGLKQNEFFRLIMRKYIDKDENMMYIINEYKKLINTQSNEIIKKSKKLIDAGRVNENKFGLSDGEKENIFDILEKELSE